MSTILGRGISLYRLNFGAIFQQAFYHSGQGVYGHRICDNAEDASNTLSKSRHENDCRLHRLVDAYRTYGHCRGQLDPLKLRKKEKPMDELNIETYGLRPNDRYEISNLINGWRTNGAVSTSEILTKLDEIYCGVIGAEFAHLETMQERDWFAAKFETINETYPMSNEDRRQYAKIMLECESFDHFLAKKFATVKRYGGEGAESMMAFFWETFRHSTAVGVEQIVACMPHRGRLNLLTTIFEFPAAKMFQKMQGKIEFPLDVEGLGDVLSHLTTSSDLEINGKKLHFTLLPNPSHLEANNPVAVGKARARMQTLAIGQYGGKDDATRVLCLQVHGDASFTGQGVVAETLALSQSPHFSVDGSVHLIVNNQIGFTTEAERGRSSFYCSDIAKSLPCPVLHVNGDHPEAVARAARLALDYRQKFRKDILVDLVCFRRWGHNELDDPTFTQPVMYKAIESRPSIPILYADKLEAEGIITNDDRKTWLAEHTRKMDDELKRTETFKPIADHLKAQWSGFVQAPPTVEIWDTGVDAGLLHYVGARSVTLPENFTAHSHLKKMHCDARLKKLAEGDGFDWATAEALAFGSLLYQGIPVRISGQDVGRGTFSNRHVMLVDRSNDQICVPLNHIIPEQKAFLEVSNSILSEEAVLGFEYGMAIENPNRLIIWEAQFGDFFNAAQVVIDTYLSSGESKWLLQNGLVMLLPHGFDGAGPEHSSCRIERFLQMTDSKEDALDGENVNMHVVHPTTSAQYFHLLRRQVLRNYRKPLIVASPKILLRLPAASSGFEDLAPGSHFRPVLGDALAEKNLAQISKVVFCSGKHYYALAKHKEANKLNHVALIRLEALCPFPAAELQRELKKYMNASSFVWSQEEPRNAGPWSFVRPRFQNLVGCNLRYAGRPELPIVAVAIGSLHQQQHDKMVQDTFA